LEFQIQKMERRVARASGERTVDETNKLKKEITELSDRHDKSEAE